MKRVYALYRVSTAQQVDKEKNDIPMQKQASREFARKQGWQMLKEFEEKGVSGFKVSATNRDAIQDLKEAALHGEFDILLVFMFDRIGRIDDETPFVVEWFVKHDIEVWSVLEGEQRFDSHVDKLTNYIRFWQASGESMKTSQRIKTRIQQLTLEGQYTGGPVPYGYRLVKTGRLNKKGVETSELAIEPSEAEMVRLIFHKTIVDGYGSHRLASLLNDKGLKTHNGSKFQCNTIIRILRNRLYCGYLTAGDAISPLIERLKIIDDADYERAQFILAQRAVKDTEKRQIALSTKGKTMLSGNLFCAHCGGRITARRYQDRYTRKDGSEYYSDYMVYHCYHKNRKLCDCDGQATYRADKVDAAMSLLMHDLFSRLEGSPSEDKLQNMYKKQMEGNRAMQKKLSLELKKNHQQLETLQLEIVNSLSGDSVYSPDDLAQALATVKNKIAEAEQKLSELENEERIRKVSTEMIIPSYNQFKSWADEFDSATPEQKKMIACQLFKRIELGRGYTITVELNMTYQQFCTEWSNTRILTAV